MDPKDPYEVFLNRSVAPAALAANGMAIVNKESPIEIPVDVTDFSVFVTRIKALEPDVVLVGVAHEALAGFLKEANRQKLDVPMFAGLGSITDAVADAAKGIRCSPASRSTRPRTIRTSMTYVKEFAAASEKALPGQYSNPIYADAGAYEGIYMFAAAIRAGKITGATPVKEARTRIRDYLASLRDFPGLGNAIAINKDGDAIKKTIVFATKDGKWVRQ